ncbi:hypothetical protein A3B85_02465 [Candidatus Nomurabacteria bacterium RIFCSPHIGHO2_02_FULL_37_13]|uniref:Uncharacterized protein n=1 Tax=Candidatus Nomurabacteria bacterium RIFCSPHIGHO2_02_FULL_37_13 TaxID=1801750 RepID=A0A1F6W4N1_9BACT|nr:MAG: hypothetical protein A2640_00305 [Candidatus Nomurabacteria bacterium RIFCSPHIGHO2_01_FULL_36_23]OGI76762.1 MAG: hypothetical protein A3B85_02465 [Candidatus Nomurabacteria bacterium RIFCSPHIGHO2_02_FULL_37_13]OGI88491.1 MAG: hypothetical protein A2906_00065 [Candidatus Nomurabacteria bacterium RIFCSPLOWO2_01_FULL_37_25]
MKNNKGFAPIAIILIIFAVLAVGGVAYYAGKSSSPTTQNIPENNYQPAGQNIPVVNSNNTTPNQQNANSVEGYITSQKVGIFDIGEPVPDQSLLLQAKYSIKETTIFTEGIPVKQYVVSMGSKDLLTLGLPPNSGEKIWDISVISPEFKTKEGIGVGSTVSDFLKAYPNYKFWYSQEEGEHFVLNTSSNATNPQFFLDRSGLINPNENFNYPTYRQAKISDFKTSAKITGVRVYFSP